MASTINLTDAELRQELKKFGENPGPINANTRTLYTRKLIKLRDSKVEVFFGIFLLFVSKIVIFNSRPVQGFNIFNI